MGRRLALAERRRPPLRFGDDPLLWASWLYYEEGLTQGEIADAMGTSRPTINAYLADARARGIVRIAIATDSLRGLTVARAIEDHFDLDDCYVIPAEGGPRPLIDRLGAAGAQVAAALLRPGDVVAITWGRTMLALAGAMAPARIPDLTVVQATGGTTAAIPYTPEACTTRLADQLGARVVPISAPAILSSAAAREMMLSEPVIAEQMAHLARVNRVLFGVSSLRPSSTLHVSGFLDHEAMRRGDYATAVGSLAGRFINAAGDPVAGPLDDRTVGMGLEQLRNVPTRVLVAGGPDKVAPILAALRGGYAGALVTDADTAEAVLRAAGIDPDSLTYGSRRGAAQGRNGPPVETLPVRDEVKKFINAARDAVNEALEGALMAHPRHLAPIGGNLRALARPGGSRQGKVGLVIGGGAGHEPCFLGFVGEGLADAVAIGNVFASPPPDRILTCTKAADQGAGVLYIYGNYTGDMMNFDMAAELAAAEGIETRTVVTTDDIASAGREDRQSRRGTAGNVFVFKIAGAACARMLPLAECERLARKANDACLTVGVALEPCSIPDTRRPSFQLGPDFVEFGVGVHGEPGMRRDPMRNADGIVDQICDRLFAELPPEARRVAVLVNSLGGTPGLELFVLRRRLGQRLAARGIAVEMSLVGHYCTSLDMVGASITLMVLDDQLAELLDDPCDGFAWRHQPG